MVCLSKSLSGYGLPFALLLHRPELDQWSPGEDNGTFRGNTLAFVAATKTLQEFWSDDRLVKHIQANETLLKSWFAKVTERFAVHIKQVRGRGLFYGIEFYDASLTAAVTRACFTRRLIIERCGPQDQVLKLMPALTIDAETLQSGLASIFEAMQQVLEYPRPANRTRIQIRCALPMRSPMSTNNNRAIIELTIGGLMLSLSALAVAFAHIGAGGAGFYRMLIASILFFLLLKVRKTPVRLKAPRPSSTLHWPEYFWRSTWCCGIRASTSLARASDRS